MLEKGLESGRGLLPAHRRRRPGTGLHVGQAQGKGLRALRRLPGQERAVAAQLSPVQFDIFLRFPKRAAVAFDLLHHPALRAPGKPISSAAKAQLQTLLGKGAKEAHFPLVVGPLTGLVALLNPKAFEGGQGQGPAIEKPPLAIKGLDQMADGKLPSQHRGRLLERGKWQESPSAAGGSAIPAAPGEADPRAP